MPNPFSLRCGIVLLAVLMACGAHAQSYLQQLPQLDEEEIAARRAPGFDAYRLRGNNRTVVLDFPSLREQGLAFGRIVLFIERDGAPRNRVLSMAEADAWLSRNGHRLYTLTYGNNFRTEELARFFNAVRRQGDRLTPDEKFLHDWLLRVQLLRADGRDLASAADAVVITVPQPSRVDGCVPCTVLTEHRAAILSHELAHARFATSEAYQSRVLRFWAREMSDATRVRFTEFLRRRGYDAGNDELLANEMQAFLMHTPHAAMFSAKEVGLTEDELADLRKRFNEGLGAAAM